MGLKRKIIAVSLCLIMMLSSINVNVIDAKAETVTVSVKNNPKVDIILTKKDTSLNLNNFENDVKKSLQDKGIDTSNIKFSTLQSETIKTDSNDVNFSNVVNSWETIGMKTWTATTDGKIYSDVDGDNGWYGTSLINPTADIDNVEFNFTMVTGGRLNEGICFNVTINSDKTLNGYFLSICNHSNSAIYLYKFENYKIDQGFNSGINARLWCNPWQIDCGLGNQHTVVIGERYTYDNNAFTALAGHDSVGETNVKYNVKYENGQILVYANNQKVIDVKDNTYTHGTYGFWGNNCEQKAKMYISNFSVSTKKEGYLSFKELLTQPKWREDAEHVIVNVDNNIDDTLTGSDTMGEILSRTLADKIHFIQWGTETNKSASKDFIARNDNNGLFTYNNNYNQAVEDTVNYIISLIKQNSDSNYVIAGEDTDLEVSPANLKNNAVSSTYPNGRWLIKHDDTYFANSEGKIADTYQKNLSYDFSKSGKYEIYFDGQKVKEIYAHRKPVADFDIAISGSKLTLTSKSYDLDSNDNIGYGAGITSEKWYYKEATATKWTSGKLNTFTKNKIYIIKLDVTDKQGVTSSAIKYVGTGLPVANFNISSSTITTADKLIVKDTSYDPQGNDITKYEWVLKKNGTTIGTYTSKEFPDINFNASGYKEGTYNITLKITNNIGTESEAFTKTFTVETAKYKNKYEHWAWGFNNEGNNNTKQAFLLQTTYGEETYGEEFSPDASYALTVPNGYTLAPRFGNGQITGKWTTFNFGTKITQPSYVMNFEYDYYPTDYTVTYNLDGGTNNSFNPDSYTVLYGVTFAEPTKKGYDFLGWYDANGNKITGINEGCNATFSDTADLYSKLKTRTTGNISVTAKWKKHDYSITTNKTGSGAISNSGIVTYTNNTSVFIIPAEGYITSSLKIDGVSVSPVTKYNFLNVEKDHKVEAIFTISQNRKMELMQKGYKWIDLKL